MTEQFPEIVAALAGLPNAVHDGELVVPEANGESDFDELRRRNLFHGPQMIAEPAALPGPKFDERWLDARPRDTCGRPTPDAKVVRLFAPLKDI